MQITAALLLILTCLAFPGCKERPASGKSTGQAAGQSKKLRYFDLSNLDVRDVPMLMALDDLTGQGYEVEKTYLASGALIADALSRGDADIGLVNNQTMWIAVTKGAAARTMVGFTTTTTVLAARAEIPNCAGLHGKRLAVAATRGLGPALLNKYMKQNCPGATPDVLVITESAGRAAALLTGEIDAEVVPREEFLKLQIEAPGKFREIMSYASAFPTVLVEGVHVRRQWAEENPAGAKDFIRALLRAQRQIASNPQLLFNESVKRLSLEPDIAQAIGETHLRMGIWDAKGGLTVKNIGDTIEFLTGIDALPPGVKVEDVADLSFLHAVLQEDGRP